MIPPTKEKEKKGTLENMGKKERKSDGQETGTAHESCVVLVESCLHRRPPIDQANGAESRKKEKRRERKKKKGVHGEEEGGKRNKDGQTSVRPVISCIP